MGCALWRRIRPSADLNTMRLNRSEIGFCLAISRQTRIVDDYFGEREECPRTALLRVNLVERNKFADIGQNRFWIVNYHVRHVNPSSRICVA